VNEHAAVKHYHGPERYNCAQAVAKGLERTPGENAGLVAAMAKCGGGRAEGGLCGALFAARELLSTDAAREQVSVEFERQAGFRTCREIRKLHKLACKECVNVAAQAADVLLAPQGEKS